MATEPKITIRISRKHNNFWANTLANLVCLLPEELRTRIWLSKLGRKLFFDVSVVDKD